MQNPSKFTKNGRRTVIGITGFFLLASIVDAFTGFLFRGITVGVIALIVIITAIRTKPES